MDNSQSSDIFSETSTSLSNLCSTMNFQTYEELLSKTKATFGKFVDATIQNVEYSSHFSSLLNDCSSCVSQSLELVIGLLEESVVSINKLHGYLDDAVCLLQMLSNFIKNVIETVAMSCCSMTAFPTATGNIMLTVFIHCKDSECIYGQHLASVEKHLKELFRSCHELQLTYLMVLEKQFIFDLTEKDEQIVLLEALDINLKIGETVQCLDVKTMAEQWKAYTMICEKYSKFLLDKNIYNKCSALFLKMIENNVNTALEVNQDDKVAVRSLKVASFTIKIFLRIFNVFKHVATNNHKHVIQLLLYVHRHNTAYLELELGKSMHFLNLIQTNVHTPMEALVNQLVYDETFLNCFIELEISSFKDNKLLAYILLIVSIMKSFLQGSKEQAVIVNKYKLINCIFNVLPRCHVWFNLKLRFESNERDAFGLYEHLLTHTVAFATTLDLEQFAVLENRMYEAVLDVDCWRALFSSHLWILLTRIGGPQYSLNTLLSLCQMYKKLEGHPLFANSPQDIHLKYLMSKIFGSLTHEQKISTYKQFNLQNDSNIGIWSVLKVQNLPLNLQITVGQMCMEKLNNNFAQLTTTENIQDVYSLIKLMHLAAISKCENIEEFLVKAWMKGCPKHIFVLQNELNSRTKWYFRYIEALVSLTDGVGTSFLSCSNTVKILHVILNIFTWRNTELPVLLVNLFCDLLLRLNGVSKPMIESHLGQALRIWLQETDNTTREYLFRVLIKYAKSLDSAIVKIINEESLQEEWAQVMNYKRNTFNNEGLKSQLQCVEELKFSHKCIASVSEDIASLKKTHSNFEFADIDSLFDVDSDCDQPASKKAKIDLNEIEDLLTRLENDTATLCQMKKYNVLYKENKKRILAICDTLKNIVS